MPPPDDVLWSCKQEVVTQESPLHDYFLNSDFPPPSDISDDKEIEVPRDPFLI